MKREDLLTLIERAKRIEEDAVQSLSKHIDSASQWAGLESEEHKRIHDVLKILADDSKAHAGMLDKIKVRVMKGDKDVY